MTLETFLEKLEQTPRRGRRVDCSYIVRAVHDGRQCPISSAASRQAAQGLRTGERMTPIYSPTHRDVDLFMAKLEEEEEMRAKQAALAYARYQRQGKTFEVTGSTLRRLFFWGAVAVWFVWWIF